MSHKYYVAPSKFQGTFDLRQERFRGKNHPHDIMASGFTAQQMRELIASMFPDTDVSALPAAEAPTCYHGLGYDCPHCWG